MIELVHDQRQIDALHTSMVAPGFAQTVSAKVPAQAYLPADGGDDFPGLTTSDRMRKTVGFAIEKDEMIFVCGRVSRILCKSEIKLICERLKMENTNDTKKEP